MSEKPVDKDVLTRAFPKNAIKQRVGGGNRKYDYVETQTVIRRLNEATDNRWDYVITRLEWHGDLLIATGELTIPGLGTRSGTGVQKVNDRGGEDLIKGAASDCLKNCAKLFGVALELYGEDYEGNSEPAQHPAPPKERDPRQPVPTAEKSVDDHQTLTDYQNRQIHELKKALGIENKDFTKALTKHYGKILITDLTRREAVDLLAKLKAIQEKQRSQQPAEELEELPDFPA